MAVLGNQLVTMSDGDTKYIQDVQVGDIVKSNFCHSVVSNIVISVYNGRLFGSDDQNVALICTADQKLYSNDWANVEKKAENFNGGFSAYMNGGWIPVEFTTTGSMDKCIVYSLELEDQDNYVVNGYSVFV